MILLIDNYDSFSYNLYQLIGTVNPDIKVIRNDEMTVDAVELLQPELIVLSPGPGNRRKPVSVKRWCTGLQENPHLRGMSGASGHMRSIRGQNRLRKGTDAWKDFRRSAGAGKQAVSGNGRAYAGSQIPFAGSGSGQHAGRACYYGENSDGEIIGCGTQEYPVYGVQFHPESVLTPEGMDIIRNLLSEAAE